MQLFLCRNLRYVLTNITGMLLEDLIIWNHVEDKEGEVK